MAPRGGNPSFNPILNADDIKDQFNATDRVDDVKNYLQSLAKTLQWHGYPPEEATAAARTLLPDVLRYDRARPARYPNGRVPTDDVFSARMIFMTHGRTTAQSVGPHDDLLDHFPTSARPTRSGPAGLSPRRATIADAEGPRRAGRSGRTGMRLTLTPATSKYSGLALDRTTIRRDPTPGRPGGLSSEGPAG